ncbi:MAG: glycosyltransferase family 2 protein [Alphaproteobacteria bacterium]|nr:glycosyltransferase family 2 protein [Alphaproteobacteria bacterium]
MNGPFTDANKMQGFAPKRMLDINIAAPFPDIQGVGGPGKHGAIILVRNHGRSIGLVEIEPGRGRPSSSEVADLIWRELASAINDDLSRIGCSPVAELTPSGLTGLSAPPPLLACPPVTVLIATRDRAETLDACLRSVLALDYPAFDVIVVDSAPSSGETADLIASRYAGKAPVCYIREDSPGLAIAHNAGLEKITAPFVAITDDDVVVDRGWLKAIIREFNRSPKVACVTGLILPIELETPAQDLIEQFGGFAKGFSPHSFSLANASSEGVLFPYAAGAFGSGANMAFRRSSLLEIGGFDPALGAGTAAQGGDDLAAFFDVIARGFELVYAPDAVLWHRHRRDYAGVRRQAFGYGVGLGAYVASLAVKHPLCLIDMMWRMPKAVAHVLSSNSSKNNKKTETYPRELTRLEWLGLLRGPFRYGSSLWKTRDTRRRQRRALATQRVLDVSAG